MHCELVSPDTFFYKLTNEKILLLLSSKMSTYSTVHYDFMWNCWITDRFWMPDTRHHVHPTVRLHPPYREAPPTPIHLQWMCWTKFCGAANVKRSLGTKSLSRGLRAQWLQGVWSWINCNPAWEQPLQKWWHYVRPLLTRTLQFVFTLFICIADQSIHWARCPTHTGGIVHM